MSRFFSWPAFMICVFDVVEGPAKGKRFWIRLNEKFEVGRISTADFSVPQDLQMSRHHLILEGRLTGFQVRDAGSTNGTFVNDAKIRSIELCDGDRIRAGDSIFDVSVLQTAAPPAETPLADSDTKPPNEEASSDADSEILSSLDSDGDSTNRVHSEILMEQTYRSQTASLDVWESLGFQRSANEFLLVESSNQEDPSAIGVNGVLERLHSEYTVQALIQVGPLRRFETQLLLRLGVTENELQQACVLLNDVGDSPEFRVFADGLLSRDALVLAGYHQQDAALMKDWNHHFAPSELNGLTADEMTLSRDHFDADCAWVLFEQASTERLQVIDFSVMT
ncbi:MAG: FHA domain-containing protein [Planctomycetota bacterium]